jgi:hypothetical protein
MYFLSHFHNKDGVPKDPNYIYRLYVALEKYEDAAKTALLIARQEQDLGNYNLAHSVIQETIRKLEDRNIKVYLIAVFVNYCVDECTNNAIIWSVCA